MPHSKKSQYDDITLVIQGPVDRPDRLDFLDVLDEYKQSFPNIIVSTWDEHVTREFVDRVNHRAQIYTQKLSDIPSNLILPYNIGHQVLSTLGGLNVTKTPYAMKLRVDERYSNLWKVADKFLEDTDKYVTGSSFLCPKSDGFFFEAPDHIMTCKTTTLLDMFKEALRRLHSGTYDRNEHGDPAPEITFTKSYLTVRGEEADMHRHDQLMVKYFDFVNDRELYPFMLRCNSGNMRMTEISQIDPSLEGVHDMYQAINRQGVKW